MEAVSSFVAPTRALARSPRLSSRPRARAVLAPSTRGGGGDSWRRPRRVSTVVAAERAAFPSNPDTYAGDDNLWVTQELSRALDALPRRRPCDGLVLTRGSWSATRPDCPPSASTAASSSTTPPAAVSHVRHRVPPASHPPVQVRVRPRPQDPRSRRHATPGRRARPSPGRLLARVHRPRGRIHIRRDNRRHHQLRRHARGRRGSPAPPRRRVGQDGIRRVRPSREDHAVATRRASAQLPRGGRRRAARRDDDARGKPRGLGRIPNRTVGATAEVAGGETRAERVVHSHAPVVSSGRSRERGASIRVETREAGGRGDRRGDAAGGDAGPNATPERSETWDGGQVGV